MITDDVKLGEGVRIFQNDLVILYGCTIGNETLIGPFVEIQKNVEIGARCKISSHTFICDGVIIEDEVFIGHGVMFTNTIMPYATNEDGSMQINGDWELGKTQVKKRASIGNNATILSGIQIGENAIVGAGAVVTKDVPPRTIVVENPARILSKSD